MFSRILMVAALFLGCGGCSKVSGPEVSGPEEKPPELCPSPGLGVTVGSAHPLLDTSATPVRRVVLMGGGSEDDEASTLFVEGASGGDILILRASGSLTSYPNYFYSLSPDVSPASAVTVLTGTPAAGGDPAVLCWLGGAEAVWLAGGAQSDYLRGWPASLHAGLAEANVRGLAVGGTSAGAVSLGEAAFDARFGSITSAEALADPLHQDVSLSYPSFAAPELSGVYVDSHFSQRGREGRLLVFLARFLEEKSRGEVLGLGLDERVALVIEDGSAQVYAPEGRWAWLYRVTGPVQMSPGEPLNLWGIERVRLGHEANLGWPPDFETLVSVGLKVEEGVVEVLSQ